MELAEVEAHDAAMAEAAYALHSASLGVSQEAALPSLTAEESSVPDIAADQVMAMEAAWSHGNLQHYCDIWSPSEAAELVQFETEPFALDFLLFEVPSPM